MRFEDVRLESLDLDCGDYEGSYCVPATDELIDITNTIRKRAGNTDLVGVGYDNDVYYNHYLLFNTATKELSLQASVAHGEKDDFTWYNIDLFPEEKEMLLWKVVNELLNEL